ncbi:phosphoribosylanthranilate isomerase [Tunturibacter empetritectus]|uniref:N-(5'-phosphoribosyl)anthranilate isomerase n=1 Tax=Tunturiibacter empetritectus TaxID=3069691 RepID=A0A7W8MR93_9BACT|nr:phosphoribosylanthranilate isomerase [Edaphobacter lichenicola]MBB5317398.1 phosphoribosylanthranilate isomerase [Edaphobacter lichenicola]
MWIKICANTNLDDAKLAAELGADALGFVFAPSPRRVTSAEVAKITPHLPSTVERVGVFYAVDAYEIARAAHEAGLTAVQLHSGVDFALLHRLHKLFAGQVSLIQTVHWNVEPDVASGAIVAAQLRKIAADGLVDRVLIDSKVGAALGGTGVSFDWDTARNIFDEAAPELRLIVAGGLRPENVAEAIQGLNPWGVDVASGVELEPGKKSPEKLAAFIRKARESRGDSI